MRSVCLTLSLALLSGATASADIFDAFEELHPVDSYMTESLPAMNLGGDTCCTGSCCTESCCVCPPAPTMIGDSLGIPFHMRDGAGARMSFPNFYSKVADNNSAMPQDRVYLTYQFFNDYDVNTIANGPISKRDLQLYTIGMEKTFADGDLSAELIVPFSYSPSPQYINGANFAPASQMELQDIAVGLKALLLENNSNALSIGVRVEIPTAADIHAVNVPGELENQAWTVTPYLALLHYLSEDTFFQAFAAYRLQTDDNWVTQAGAPFQAVREPGYLNLDAQLGHWLYRNHGSSGLTGLQAKIEAHYTGSYEPVTPQGPSATMYFEGEQDFLNLTAGLTALFNDNATLTVGFVAPIRDGSATRPGVVNTPSDRLMDWEAMVQFNYYFGN